ncbi:MAG: hypothetical protein HY276_11435 [Ignavibacteriales bacterium]|nr:hypothetical protein [Ignavibacteriales bacterium]
MPFSTLIAQTTPSAQYLTRISLSDTEADTSLPASIRDSFEDDDGRPLRSFSCDLNGDGVEEKFIPNEFLAGTGGAPWVIYDPGKAKVIGTIDAGVIFVQIKSSGSYRNLECYWGLGGGEGIVTLYTFSGNSYKRSKARNLKDAQLEKYFEDRKPVKALTKLRR